MAATLTGITVEKTNRIPVQVEVNFCFDDGQRVGMLVRVGSSQADVANRLHTIAQTLKRLDGGG